jgi:hypothetical protein
MNRTPRWRGSTDSADSDHCGEEHTHALLPFHPRRASPTSLGLAARAYGWRMDPQELHRSSRRWMQAGIEAFSQDSATGDFAVHHAGVALEHLLKAYLASLHPALIVDAKSFDSLLHATGLQQHASISAAQVRTIGLSDALKRVDQLLLKPSGIAVNKSSFDAICEARNGVAHLGIYGQSSTRDVLANCIRIAVPVLQTLNIDGAEYWDKYQSLCDQIVDEHATAVQVGVEAKLVQARDAYQSRISGLDAAQAPSMLVALTANPVRISQINDTTKCPACASQGWLSGSAQGTGERVAFGTGGTRSVVDRDGNVVQSNWVVAVFFPEWFYCNVCGLDLGVEEFDYVNLPKSCMVDLDPKRWQQHMDGSLTDDE